MEFPQPFAAEGRKPTHDFLSLYSHSTAPQDPVPPCPDNYLKTHDFLQPLERMGRTNSTKEEEADGLPVVVQRPAAAAAPPSVEHLLPGGIGTYTVTQISNFTQRALRPEGSIFPAAQSCTRDRNYDNSICSSYGSGFTLWEESAAKKGKTGKENMAQESGVGESGSKAPKWTPFERPPQLSSNNILIRHSSQSAARTTGQKNQSFMDIMESSKVHIQQETVDDVEEFVIKTESETTQKGRELNGKMHGKSTEQRPNTPRSKHSATEQRRRGKINDRFQMLRQLIPHSDQKRDKASFLLEVIEYIRFLQEKVHKYEESFRGWTSEPEKMMPWRNNPRPEQNLDDQSIGVKNGSSSDLFAANNDEKNTITSLALPANLSKPMESEISAAPSYLGSDQNPGTIQKDSNSASDNIKAKGLTMEGGTISISSVYSQGLLSTLTQALQGCGVDLSQASVSVQIDVGKQANIRRSLQQLSQKEIDSPASNQEVSRSRIASSEESDQPLKKFKTR